MSEEKISRVVCIVMALFPALWGIFSFLNNTADFSGTAQSAVAPLLSMEDTYNVPGQMWRAIHFASAPSVGLTVITSFETLAGIFGLTGVLMMLANLCKPYSAFSRGKTWAILGATFAILVWGIGFMVVAGDWFMAWQAKNNPLATQLGAMIYMVPNALTIIILLQQKDAA